MPPVDPYDPATAVTPPPAPAAGSHRERPPGRIRPTATGEFFRVGSIETFVNSRNTVAMLVLLQCAGFEAAGDWQKGLLSSSKFLGLLLGPLAVQVTLRLGLSVSRASALALFAAVPGLVLAALAWDNASILIGIGYSVVMVSSTAPLVTALWRQNVRTRIRGRVFSQSHVAGALVSLLLCLGISLWLGEDAGRFREVYAGFAGLLVVAGVVVWRIPSRGLDPGGSRNPLACLALLWKHPLFGYVSVAWWLIGIANLSTIPLRTQFTGAGSAEGGLAYAPWLVVVLTMAIPDGCRFLAGLVWGRLFDRVNFIALRIGINLCFAASLLLFFLPHLVCQVGGAVMFGVAAGGGMVAWNLWVTKFSPPERTADYMAAHTVLTGLRGLVGPLLAFYALNWLSVQDVAGIAVKLIILACLLFVPIIPYGANRGAGLRRAP